MFISIFRAQKAANYGKNITNSVIFTVQWRRRKRSERRQSPCRWRGRAAVAQRFLPIKFQICVHSGLIYRIKCFQIPVHIVRLTRSGLYLSRTWKYQEILDRAPIPSPITDDSVRDEALVPKTMYRYYPKLIIRTGNIHFIVMKIITRRMTATERSDANCTSGIRLTVALLTH